MRKALSSGRRKRKGFPNPEGKHDLESWLRLCKKNYFNLQVALRPAVWLLSWEFPPLLPCAVCVSCSVMFNSLQPHGLQPTRLLGSWDSPSKNTGVGCHSLSGGSSQPRDWTGGFFTVWATKEPLPCAGSLIFLVPPNFGKLSTEAEHWIDAFELWC